MRFWAAALAAVVASTVLSGCMGDPQPWPTVRDFLLAWQNQHYRQAALKTTGQPEQVADALRQAEEELGARDLRMRVEHISAHGDTAEATFLVRMWLDGIGRRWTYDGHMQLRRRNGDWKVQWDSSVVHPKLNEGEELAVLTDPPSPAPVLGSDGKPLARIGGLTNTSPAQAGAASGDGKGAGLGLELAFRQRLAGTAGSKVVTLKAGGAQVGVLATFPGKPSKPVHATIDGDVQEAAEAALDNAHEPAALVAVQASTGKVLAVANRPAESNRALTGKYRPGPPFTIVAAQALLSNGMKVSSPVPCPRQRIVDGQKFRGSSEASSGAGAPTLRTAFVDYCETAFVGMSRKLSDGELRQTATTMGIGGEWELPVPAFAGKAPTPAGPADRAAATIGQGDVRVSPLNMALVAAAVDAGTWHPPTLVTKPKRSATAEPHRLPAGHAKKLRRLMRAAVESGAAGAVDLPGSPVHGVAGVAGVAKSAGGGEPPAWFVGFRGDLAFAVLIEGSGGDSGGAAPVAVDFLRELNYEEAIAKPRSTRGSNLPGGS